MKKTNLVLCILAVFVFLAQMFFMMQPYYTYTPRATLKQQLGKEPMPEPVDVSLEGFVWMDYTNASTLLIERYMEMEDKMIEDGVITEEERVMPATPPTATLFPTEDQKDVIGENSNNYVLGIVLTTVCGAVMVVMTIFTRKSWVGFMFSVFWAAASAFLAFDTSNLAVHHFGNPDAMAAIIPKLEILAYAAIGLVALRAVPWFLVRWTPYKLPLKKNIHEKNWVV